MTCLRHSHVGLLATCCSTSDSLEFYSIVQIRSFGEILTKSSLPMHPPIHHNTRPQRPANRRTKSTVKNTTLPVLCKPAESFPLLHFSSQTSWGLDFPQSPQAHLLMAQCSLFYFHYIHWHSLHGWVSLHELLTQWMETRNVLRCTTFSSPTGIRL